jgi:hypothetical protein
MQVFDHKQNRFPGQRRRHILLFCPEEGVDVLAHFDAVKGEGAVEPADAEIVVVDIDQLLDDGGFPGAEIPDQSQTLGLQELGFDEIGTSAQLRSGQDDLRSLQAFPWRRFQRCGQGGEFSALDVDIKVVEAGSVPVQTRANISV